MQELLARICWLAKIVEAMLKDAASQQGFSAADGYCSAQAAWVLFVRDKKDLLISLQSSLKPCSYPRKP